jgi:UDP-GlcNAc:undecaprenyl-phosphate/decaprenyl-phosphate GlcNAc-1-phosphate transferase
MLIFLIMALVFLCVFLTMPIFRRIALALKIVDVPGPRSVHKTVTARFGGVAIVVGFWIGLGMLGRIVPGFGPVLAAGMIIFALGVIEDITHLSASFRIIVQSIAVVVLLFSGVRVNFLPQGFWFDAIEAVITWLWIVGVVNAYNYLDGLDGLAAGSAVINLACFGVILFSTGQTYLLLICGVLAAACLGFLPHNFRQKKMFLGDAGSTFLGFMLASIAIVGNWAQENTVRLSIPVLILGVPIFDMIFTTIMRIKESKVKTIGQWLKYGGRDHFHHYLLDIGLLSHGAVTFIFFITFSLGISAIMLSNDRTFEAVLTLSQAGIIFGVIATLIVIGKRRRVAQYSPH